MTLGSGEVNTHVIMSYTDPDETYTIAELSLASYLREPGEWMVPEVEGKWRMGDDGMVVVGVELLLLVVVVVMVVLL